jgi:hypothetical protein
MNYVFLCEFIEMRSRRRDARAQGGGVHGNAVLTRLDVSGAEGISHSHHPIDWNAGQHPLTRCARPRCPALALAGCVCSPIADSAARHLLRFGQATAGAADRA